MTPNAFEDRLLAELRHIVAERPAPAAAAPDRSGFGRAPRSPRPRLLAGATATAAAAAVAVLLASGGGGATPAYAVEREGDGSVTVEISSLRDADGLERKLRAAGIPAVVDYTPEGKTCKQPRGRVATGNSGSSSGSASDAGPATFTFGPGFVKPGQTVVITTSLGEHVSSLGMEIIEGAVAPCQLVDGPPIRTAPAGAAAPAGGAQSGVKSLGSAP